MARFQVDYELKCDRNEVLNKLKDIRSIPTYWKGTRELQVISDDGKVAYAKVRFAFPASGKVRITRLDDGIRMDYLEGPFTGYQETLVGTEKIVSTWDVKFNWMFKMMEKKNVEHFKEGTKHALMRLQGIEVQP
ncbi:hypothetical protein [Sulfuracidifex tepidarius]|uniref:Coenzyme Q-binding protein COQ10 START domain-containing protein n=1 Tax=Sulfuracidifex tepidarius TaxID=1294262 RepID=A0A510DU00_9CREN|nr:hypothetical protein [Sulfuracidifex tepidarius]BBG23540.1 hypothetical protein IC006_0824 [Sulfuracidifex tepidarius]BBG26294.1 hypothetical protein IC007_0799 [Sulfuracidifex tepidarius]